MLDTINLYRHLFLFVISFPVLGKFLIRNQGPYFTQCQMLEADKVAFETSSFYTMNQFHQQVRIGPTLNERIASID